MLMLVVSPAPFAHLNPRAVMLVHGNEANIKAFQPLLREALGGSIPIDAPANGT
jgi:hypothetical protein